jgi:hypothetical protein
MRLGEPREKLGNKLPTRENSIRPSHVNASPSGLFTSSDVGVHTRRRINKQTNKYFGRGKHLLAGYDVKSNEIPRRLCTVAKYIIKCLLS